MASLGNESDAGFFNLIHQLAIAGREEEGRERRQQRRQEFQSIQRIAVPRGAGVPDESEFIEVQCRDLTRQGFSFLLPTHPTFSRLVAAFGAAPNVIYVLTKVSRCDDVLVYPSGSMEHVVEQDAQTAAGRRSDPHAQSMVLVGCRFIERLTK